MFNATSTVQMRIAPVAEQMTETTDYEQRWISGMIFNETDFKNNI